MPSIPIRLQIPVFLIYGIIIGILAASNKAFAADEITSIWPGVKSEFHSFDHYSFKVDDLNCRVVAPKKAAPGKPWIWRARFFGHEPQTDIALLQHGFHVAYVDVSGLFGAPEAVKRWSAFYDYLTSEHGLARKPALEGMSRGGLIVYNWASKNPEKVSCIYADAPVCDFKSWPGVNQRILEVYGLTREQALAYPGNPVDNLKSLADAKVPILHVVGDADKVVPVDENTAVIEQRYKALGGNITVIHKPGIGHHPHSLEDPAPIVEFILKHATPTPHMADPASYLGDIVNMMEIRWPKNRTINIVCHGHSVPAGYFKTPLVDSFNAYPHLLHQALKKRHPHAVINVIVTAIGGENAVSGAQRFKQDVLTHRPDLLLIDYALNDRRAGLEKSKEAWESMIRRAKDHGIKVLLLTPTADQRADLLSPNDPLNQHAEQIRQLAIEHQVGLVDSMEAFRAHIRNGGELQSLMSQVNHPNRKGHDLVVEQILQWFPVK